MRRDADSDELIVLDPDWLGADVIGQLLSDETIAHLPRDGRITLDDLRAIIPASPPLDLARLLAAMHICAPLHPGLDNDIIIPFLDYSEEPSVEVGQPLVSGFQSMSDKVKHSFFDLTHRLT